jgi:glycosyltransferase involved in cell wall biosynthesis
VKAQTYRNIEIIVAAHGCTDGTAERLAGYDPRLRVIEVPRTRTYPPTAENHWLAGPVVPANAALKECRGEWIARIDDDDSWTPDHLEKLLNFAIRGNYEFVSSAHATHVGPIAPYDLDGVKVGGTQTWLYRSYLKFFRYNIDCWRKTYDRVNDTDLQRRMRNAGVRMGYLPEVTAYVLPRPGESAVGLAAYRDNKRQIEKQLAF